VRLLVTGASGLIGRHVAALASRNPGMELVASARRAPAPELASVGFEAADLSNADEAEALVRAVRPTHIVHAAWETRHPGYWEDESNRDWRAATARMAQAFGEIGGQRFVQIGSCAEYDWSFGTCVEDATPSGPTTLYGREKLAAFEAVQAAAAGRFEAVEARMFMVFGPGENAARFIPTICRAHAAGETPELGSGRQRRDFLHAEDAAAALLALISKGGATGIVNVASGEAVTLAEVAETLARLAGASASGLGRLPDRPGDPDMLGAAVERIRSTGWTPVQSLEQGLARSLSWWRDQPFG
jgi:nucleoside-diphosphate-sugar epimerase